jgi:WD40 repeat protein
MMKVMKKKKMMMMMKKVMMMRMMMKKKVMMMMTSTQNLCRSEAVRCFSFLQNLCCVRSSVGLWCIVINACVYCRLTDILIFQKPNRLSEKQHSRLKAMKCVSTFEVQTIPSKCQHHDSGWHEAMALSPNGVTLATFCGDGVVKIWDLGSGQCVSRLEGHGDCVSSIVFSSNGATLAVCSWQMNVKLWDLASNTCTTTLSKTNGEGDGGCFLAFSPDSNILVTGYRDCVRLWDVAACKFDTFDEYSGAWIVSFSPCGATLATVNQSQVKLWDFSTRKVVDKFCEPFLSCISFSPDGATLALGHTDAYVTLWAVTSRRQIHKFWCRAGGIRTLAFTPESAALLIGTYKAAWVWSMSSHDVVTTFDHPGPVYSLVISPDGRRVATRSDDGKVRLWADRGEAAAGKGENNTEDEEEEEGEAEVCDELL